MTTIPVTHAAESQKLNSEDYAQLFEVALSGGQGSIYFWDGPTRTYQTKTYESLGCLLTGETKTATEQESRPTFAIHNPGNAFAPYVLEGYVDGATVIRRRVLKTHFEADVPILQRRIWTVARVADLDLDGQKILLELRDPSSGQNFLFPGRVYIAPEFPSVRF
jgi:phage-related protein